MRPTMSDVAAAASVSKSTVSRALAGDTRVKYETAPPYSAGGGGARVHTEFQCDGVGPRTHVDDWCSDAGHVQGLFRPVLPGVSRWFGRRRHAAGYNLLIARLQCDRTSRMCWNWQMLGVRSGRKLRARAEAAATAEVAAASEAPSAVDGLGPDMCSDPADEGATSDRTEAETTTTYSTSGRSTDWTYVGSSLKARWTRWR